MLLVKMKSRSSRQAYLPEDLMVNIIQRLPLKYVLRFRGVNKSWYRFLSTSSFIKSSISNTNNNDRYLLCTHSDHYTLTDLSEADEDEVTCNVTRVKYHYTPKAFGVDENFYLYDCELKVYGTCNGLLCVSDLGLRITSSIYLWNPVIRKVKKISMISHDVFELIGDTDLCFGYFDDDYKIIRIARFCDGRYRVGVYSLSTDAWKVTCCGSDSISNYHYLTCDPLTTKFIGGVAYFGVDDYTHAYKLIGFDLNHESIRDVELPDEFDSHLDSISVEPWGETIALIDIRHDNLTKWVLRDCDATGGTSMWEMQFTLKLETYIPMYPLGFTKDGTYLLRDDAGMGRKYLWDFGTSQLEECASDMGAKDSDLSGNLVLLDEKTIDPFVETEPCCTQTTFVLYKIPERMEKAMKDRKKMLNKTRNRLQEIEKSRKKGRKENLDTTQNRLQGRGAKRRMEEKGMEKPRKKKNVELDNGQ